MRNLLSITLLLLWAPAGLAATYEETFTEKAGRAYNEDINVWVYTSEFARRFGMPERWVDDGLKGAYAVAFRVERASGAVRFPHKGPGVGMSIRRCMLDVYLSSEADIPWVDERQADKWWYTPDSPTYLRPQRPIDLQWRQRAVGVPHWGGVVRFGIPGKRLGGFPVREFDKRLYPGIVYISFSFGCTSPPRSATVLEFHRYRMIEEEGRLSDLRTLGLAHRVAIPVSYMERLYENWLENSREPAQGEWGRVIQK